MGNNQKFYVGVDPGLDGGLAFMRPDGLLQLWDMPTKLKKVSGKNRRFVDIERLAPRFDRHDIEMVMIEQQSTRRGLAAQSVLKTGIGFGILLGIVAANYHKHEIVTPQKWKKFMEVDSDKNKTRNTASALMPKAAHRWSRAMDDGRAEAALLALYAMQINGVEPEEVYVA